MSIPSDNIIVCNEKMIDGHNNKIAVRMLTKEQQKELIQNKNDFEKFPVSKFDREGDWERDWNEKCLEFHINKDKQ